MTKKLFGLTMLFLAIDQIIKGIVVFFMMPNQSIEVIKNFFSLTLVYNDGAAFSLFRGGRWVFILIAIVALNIIYIFFIKGKKLNKIETITYSLLLGGIMGNLIDRVVYGKVVDFLDFTIFGHDFAIFNFADICIVVAVILLIITVIKDEKNARNKSRAK